MSRIHFIGGEKGGVGKSVVARLLAQCHVDRGLPFRVFDADRSHGAMLRFYREFSTPIVLDDFSSADQLMEAAIEADQDVLVDLAAQTALPLFRWIDENDLLALAAEEGIQVVLWHVIDDGADGIDLLQRLFDKYAENACYVVVKNQGRGKDFSAFEASAARRAAERLGAEVIELPSLHAGTMRKVDHHGLSFWAAGNNRENGLGLMERQRVKVWMRKAYEQFDGLANACSAAAAPSATDATAETAAID